MNRLLSKLLTSTLAVALVGGPVVQASAQTLDGGPVLSPGATSMKVELGSQTVRSVSLSKGKSAIIELPIEVRDVHITNPAIADVALPHARRVYVMGLSSGQTDAVFFDSAGRRILALNIRVEQDLAGLAETIARVAPNAEVRAEAVNDRIILTGHVGTAADADRVVRLASSFTAKPENVLNMMTVAGKDQVLLKVQIVEMQRNVLKQFGITTARAMQSGNPIFSFANVARFSVNGGLQGGLSGSFDVLDGPGDANFTRLGVSAFERVGIVRTLAEPNLTAVSGESAKFLAGGEFPVPVAVDADEIAVEFKPYGVGLGFTPVVLSEGRISLKISTEVSELTPNGAFSFATSATGPTITLPALNVRRAETSVEMASGSQMMIAGLLRDETRQAIEGIPGLKDLNVLGGLFRSRDYQAGETELVVLVTAYIVDPVKAGSLQAPSQGLRIATDAEALLMGRLNSVYQVQPKPGASYQGPYGHVIE